MAKDETRLSSPSGAAHAASDDKPAIRTPLRRSLGSQLGTPEWVPNNQVSPWEAVTIPSAPLGRPGTDEAGPDSAECADTLVRSLPLWGRELVTLRGGVPTMRRLLAALSTLATLFVVAGAGWKF